MDADKIKNFFVHHFEKMILVLVIAASGYLMYSGWTLPNFLEKEQPERLATKATQVKSEIDVNHNDAVLPERQKMFEFDIVKETTRVDTPVDPTDYSLPQTWSGKSPNSIVRRQDPELLAPRALIVKPVATAIAIRGSRTDKEAYALASLEPADPVEKVEKPKPRESRRNRRGNMMEMMMGGGMDDMGMDMDMEMGMDMMSDMGGMGGSTPTGPGRRFDSKFDFGMRPNPTDDKRNPEPSVGWFIAGTAVVPHKELYENFKQAFQDADLYDPRRDTPFYYDIQVQRADVTNKSVDELTDEDWGDKKDDKSFVWDRTKYTQLAAYRWSGFAPEIVPSDYRDDALSTWIPPVLLDDYRTFALHPLIPMLSQKDLEKEAALENDDEEIIEFSTDMDETTLVAPGQRAGAMSMMGMDYGMGMDDMDMGDMDGMMMGMGMAMMGRGGIEAESGRVQADPLLRFRRLQGLATGWPQVCLSNPLRRQRSELPLLGNLAAQGQQPLA